MQRDEIWTEKIFKDDAGYFLRNTKNINVVDFSCRHKEYAKFPKREDAFAAYHPVAVGGWLNSPGGTAPEVRNAPNRGRRLASAGVKESRRG